MLSVGVLHEKLELNGFIGSLMILSNAVFIFIKNMDVSILNHKK